jgi:hypothetical protein
MVMRIALIAVGIVAVIGIGGAYALTSKSAPPPNAPQTVRLPDIPKAETARIAILSAQSVDTVILPVAAKHAAKGQSAPPPATTPVTPTKKVKTATLPPKQKAKAVQPGTKAKST